MMNTLKNLFQKFSKAGKILNLIFNNITSKKTVIGSANNPVVSITTYGSRASTVFITLESIARGKQLPSRLILWVNEKDFYYSQPSTIKRLKKRGLEVILCKDYGPHKKYYPYALEFSNNHKELVTADDDIIYSDLWLSELIRASAESPNQIIGYRTRRIPINQSGSIEKYSEWKLNSSINPGYDVFPTGTGGVLYPPKFIELLAISGDGSDSVFSRVDDLWLHFHAVKYGFLPRQVFSEAKTFPAIFLTQRNALFKSNVNQNQNDKIISDSYSNEIVSKISESITGRMD